MRMMVTSLALGLILVAGSAQAQSAEAEALGVQIAQSTFRVLPLEEVIAKATTSGPSGAFADVKSRPEWATYLGEAIKEEFRHDLPAIEQMVGRAFARSMTIEELRAGAALFQDPGMQAAFAAGAVGKEPPGRPSKAVERILSTPAGRSFLQRMEGIDKVLDPVFEEFIIELLPGAVRRFADKAEAGEAARRQPPVVK